MPDTRTASTDVRYALCACCADHTTGENANRLMSEIVTCPECGQPCSCEGCVAESDDPKGPRRPKGDDDVRPFTFSESGTRVFLYGEPIYLCRWRWSAWFLAWRMERGLPYLNPVARERERLIRSRGGSDA